MQDSSKSTPSNKPDKPRPDFPLFAHDSGQWAKKIRKKLHYFGSWRKDREGKAALDAFEKEWPYLKKGETPPPVAPPDAFTIRQLCNKFLLSKERRLDSGELSPRTFRDYHATCEMLVKQFGKERAVESLTPDDFGEFRAKLAKRYNVTSLEVAITRCSVIFKFAFKNKHIKAPVDYGDEFARPSSKVHQRHRNHVGTKTFEREEIVRILEAADVHIRAMVYLGINCGFGNSDVASLPQSALDLEAGWITFPRVKTEIPRRIPLWPETIQALRESLANRPEPIQRADSGLCFLTRLGRPWVRMTPKKDEKRKDEPGTPIDALSPEFRKLLKKLGINGRHRLGFYSLRHNFETCAGESCDQIAVDACMGHTDPSMGANYRHKISDGRLLAVVNTVRTWLFPPEDKTAEESGAEGGEQ